MTNLEYEHSFNVKSIEPFIDFCIKNGFIEQSITRQNRVVYENKHNSKIIARLTTDTVNSKVTTTLDFKNVSEKKDDLNISTESMPMNITNDNKEVVLSMLKTIDFIEVANNLRTRYVYVKNNVKFEIDDYIRPQMKVVAIEGLKEEVDVIYEQLQYLKKLFIYEKVKKNHT